MSVKIGEGERILATTITQQFTFRAEGELEPATAESTRPTASTRTHAGVVRLWYTSTSVNGGREVKKSIPEALMTATNPALGFPPRPVARRPYALAV
jgi:hypothetical protein